MAASDCRSKHGASEWGLCHTGVPGSICVAPCSIWCRTDYTVMAWACSSHSHSDTLTSDSLQRPWQAHLLVCGLGPPLMVQLSGLEGSRVTVALAAFVMV